MDFLLNSSQGFDDENRECLYRYFSKTLGSTFFNIFLKDFMFKNRGFLIGIIQGLFA